MKISNLLKDDLKIVEKRKIFFLIPLCIVIITAIAMLIYGLVTGSPLKLGMDFTGGYTVNVKLSTKLTDATQASYEADIKSTIESLKDKNGVSYGLKVAMIQKQGTNEESSLNVKYKAVADENVMEDEINPAIQAALQDRIFKIIPVLSLSGGVMTVDYLNNSLVKSTFEEIRQRIETEAAAKGFTATDITLDEDDAKKITFKTNGDQAFLDSLTTTVSIDDVYSGQAVKGDIISATVSGELLTNAILAICLSIVLMLVYIAFRFEISSGLAAIVALFHDILIMFCFMAIFHIEINSTFIAALITILGYSINNTIIIFDRIRENTKSLFNKSVSAATIANRSVTSTMLRSINTTLTTFVTILMVAIIGVPDIRIFALPIIIGLLSGAFSSVCIAPSVWTMWKDRKHKKAKTTKPENKAEKAEKQAELAQ